MKDLFKSPIGSYIGGEFIFEGKKVTPFISYVTSKQEARLIEADAETLELALQKAEKGSQMLEAMTAYERSAVLREIADLLKAHKEVFAHTITLEMGKPLRESKGEVDYTAGYFEWFSEEAKRVYGKVIPSQFPNKVLRVAHEPIGPVLIVTPWNFPLAMAGRKIAAAWAAGCSLIVKPSGISPLTMLLFAKVAGLCKNLPKESLSVIVGPAEETVSPMLASPIIKKISFTGSVPVGKKLYQQCSGTLKKATLELGGNAPFIIFDDADLDSAAEESLIAKFRISGQTCVCANRFLVQQSVVKPFLEKVQKLVRAFKIGDPFDPSTDLSLYIHPESVKKVKRHIENALSKGAKRHLHSTSSHEPEILTEVNPDMDVFQEETFGPLLAITAFDKDDEALELANSTPYGLASYFFTSSLDRAEKISSRLKFGIVGVNDGLPSTPQIPFGGVKDSGFGREGGPSGIYEYLTEKIISLKYGTV